MRRLFFLVAWLLVTVDAAVPKRAEAVSARVCRSRARLFLVLTQRSRAQKEESGPRSAAVGEGEEGARPSRCALAPRLRARATAH